MPDYDTSASPPAPVARVEIRTPDSEMVVMVPMLLDSGSDVTIVPLAAAQSVGATVLPYSVPLQAYDGDWVYRDRARLALRLLSYTFHGDYLVDDVEVGILGRNLLNLLLVTPGRAAPHLVGPRNLSGADYSIQEEGLRRPRTTNTADSVWPYLRQRQPRA